MQVWIGSLQSLNIWYNVNCKKKIYIDVHTDDIKL